MTAWIRRHLPRLRFGARSKWDGSLVWDGRLYRINEPFDLYVVQQPPRKDTP